MKAIHVKNNNNIFTPRKILLALALLLTNIAVASEAPLVEVANVEAWATGAEHNLYCSVNTPFNYKITSQNAAQLTWLLPEGTQVKQGQIVAKQDDFYLDREIQKLMIDIESAQVLAQYSAEEYQRLNSLNKQNLVSPSQLNNAARQAKQTALAINMLKEQLKEARHRYKHLAHKAPTSGQIFTIAALPGEFLTNDQVIAELQPDNNKELVCQLPLKKYRQSKGLDESLFKLNNGQTLTLKRKNTALNEDSQTMKLYLAIPSQLSNKMLIGERISVTMSYQSAKLTRIPHDALAQVTDGHYTWRLMLDNKVQRLPITIVSTQAEHFLIQSDLQADDIVVTFGKQGLKENQQVQTAQPVKVTKPVTIAGALL